MDNLVFEGDSHFRSVSPVPLGALQVPHISQDIQWRHLDTNFVCVIPIVQQTLVLHNEDMVPTVFGKDS